MEHIYSASISIALALTLAPLFTGVVSRTTAWMAGRRGRPLLQLYYTIFKLLHKGAVYSHTSSGLAKAGPVITLSAAMLLLVLVPAGGTDAMVSFNGDIILLGFLLGVMRISTVLAALDSGSSFEGMGASREMQFAVLLEPAIFCVFAALIRLTGSISLSGIYAGISAVSWLEAAPVLLPAAAVLSIVLVTENARIPIDDPGTHLELTMIHEVMILDHSGPDLALFEYAGALKLWITAALLAGIVCPLHSGNIVLDQAVFLVCLGVIAILIGITESAMARLRLTKVPHLLAGALALALLAFIIQIR